MTTPKTTPRAADFMRTKVHTVPPDMSLADVIRFLLKHSISNAPVVEGKDQLVGFISERDCLAFLTNETFYGSPAPPQTARTMMRRHPVCVTADTEVFALASILINHGFRHLPVTDGMTLLGIISRRDILRALNDYYDQSVEDGALKRAHPDLRQIANLRFLVRE